MNPRELFYSEIENYLNEWLNFPFEFEIKDKLKYHYFPNYDGNRSLWFHERLGIINWANLHVIISPKITLKEWTSCKYQNLLKKFPYEYGTFQLSDEERQNFYSRPFTAISVLNTNYVSRKFSPNSLNFNELSTKFYFDYNKEQSSILFAMNEDIKKISQGVFSEVAIKTNPLCFKKIEISIVRENYKTNEVKLIKQKIEERYPNLEFQILRSKEPEFLKLQWNQDDPKNWSEQKEEEEKIKLYQEFLTKSKNKYGEVYEYDFDNFFGMDTLMSIFCKKHEKYFDVTPNEHLKGKRCPKDIESSGENMVRVFLESKKIPFLQYHKMTGCFSEKNGRCYLLTFDFYLPSKNLVIEYDGGQHFGPVSIFGGEESYQRTVMLDAIKNEFCKDNKIKMLRIPYTKTTEEAHKMMKKILGIK